MCLELLLGAGEKNTNDLQDKFPKKPTKENQNEEGSIRKVHLSQPAHSQEKHMKTRLTLLIAFIVATGVVAFGQNSKSTPNPDAFASAVTGTGTTNHIAKWMSTSAIENSGIVENGAGNVGIGTSTPAAKLDVKGTGAFRDTLTLDGSAAATVGSGINPNSGQAGNPLTVTGGGAASGATDTAGGDLILAAGDGNGAGGSGAVRIQAAAAGSSGTSPDTVVDRFFIAPKSVSMGGQSGSADMFLLNLADGDAAGATVRFTINANDGGSNFAAATGSCTIVVGVNPAGNVELLGLFFGNYAETFNKVNANCSIVLGGSFNQVGIAVNDSLGFTPTTHNIYFEIDNVSGSALSNLPVPLIATPEGHAQPDPSQRVDAQHPTLTIQRSR